MFYTANNWDWFEPNRCEIKPGRLCYDKLHQALRFHHWVDDMKIRVNCCINRSMFSSDESKWENVLTFITPFRLFRRTLLYHYAIFSVYSVENESCHWKISNALSDAFTFVIWSGLMFQPKIVTCSKICSLPFRRFTGMLFGWTVCVCVLYWYRDTLVNLLRWNHSFYFTFADIAIRGRFRSENEIFS